MVIMIKATRSNAVAVRAKGLPRVRKVCCAGEGFVRAKGLLYGQRFLTEALLRLRRETDLTDGEVARGSYLYQPC